MSPIGLPIPHPQAIWQGLWGSLAYIELPIPTPKARERSAGKRDRKREREGGESSNVPNWTVKPPHVSQRGRDKKKGFFW